MPPPLGTRSFPELPVQPLTQQGSRDGERRAGRKGLSEAFQAVLVVKNPPANARDVGDVGSIHGLGRSPGGGHGNPLQYSCLENPMDTGAWWSVVHRVAKSQRRLKRLSMHCTSDSFFDHQGCSISSEGFLPTVVDVMVI